MYITKAQGVCIPCTEHNKLERIQIVEKSACTLHVSHIWGALFFGAHQFWNRKLCLSAGNAIEERKLQRCLAAVVLRLLLLELCVCSPIHVTGPTAHRVPPTSLPTLWHPPGRGHSVPMPAVLHHSWGDRNVRWGLQEALKFLWAAQQVHWTHLVPALHHLFGNTRQSLSCLEQLSFLA